MSTRRTKKGTARKNADGSTTYVYEENKRTGKANVKSGSRGVAVTYNPSKPKGKQHTSTSTARDKKERSLNRKLRRDEHVAHKEGTSRTSNSPSKTRVESAKKNIGDGNRSRRRSRRRK